jgi:hypothetical protein
MSLLTRQGDVYVKLKGSTIPFGYEYVEGSPGYAKPLLKQLEALEDAKSYIKDGAFSYREAANWLEAVTGRSISGQGLHKIVAKEKSKDAEESKR